MIGILIVSTPARVVRLLLSPDGRAVTAVETLQSHHQPAFVEPTTAAPSPHGLYVLTRTYVGRFDADGKITQPDTIRAAQVLRIPWSTNP